MYFHIWLIAKTWLNIVVDDLEEENKIVKKKILKKNIDVTIVITIYNSFIFLNENFTFISKYFNINL